MALTQQAVIKLILQHIGGSKIRGAGPALVAGVGREVIVKTLPVTNLIDRLKQIAGSIQNIRATFLTNPLEAVLDSSVVGLTDLKDAVTAASQLSEIAKSTVNDAIDATLSKVEDFALHTSILSGRNVPNQFEGIETALTAVEQNIDDILSTVSGYGSDNVITPVEKKFIIRQYDQILAIQPDLDAKAASFSVSSVTYDLAVTNLTAYLNSLTTPVVWNSLLGNTDVVGPTFTSKFSDVLISESNLRNEIDAASKSLADAAQTTATAAETAADAAQAAADAAQIDAAAAILKTDRIGDDDKLARVEKRWVIREYNDILTDQTDIDAKATLYSITTEKTAYDNAITALTVYLNTLTTPVDWDNISDYTDIVDATWQSKWSDVYTKRQLVLNKIADVAKGLIGVAQSTADDALSDAAAAQAVADAAQLDATAAILTADQIGDDDKLSRVEKRWVVGEYATILADQTDIDAKATLYSITTEKTAYDNAISALTTYLNTLTSPVDWDNYASYTTIVDATWQSKWSDVYTKRQLVLNKIADVAKGLIGGAQTAADAAQVDADAAAAAAAAAQADADAAQVDADAALADLSNIGQDNKLAKGEKRRVIREYSDITTEQSDIDAKATAYSITTQKTAYDNAVSALTTYLGTLTSPVAWNVRTDYTTIVYATWQSKWSDVYSTRQTLLNKIAEKAGTTSTWNGVTGSGKPEDDATLGANLSTNVTNVLPKYLPAIMGAGLRYKFTGAISVLTTGSTSKTIRAGAGTLYNGSSVTYNQMDKVVTGTLDAIVTYYLYVNANQFTDGGHTLEATTSNTTPYSNPENVYIGVVVVTFTSGIGGSGDSGGGGGPGACPWAESFVHTKRGWIKARDVIEGDFVRVLSDDLQELEWELVRSNTPSSQECYVVRSGISGFEVTVSESTPITLRDSSIINVTDIDGHELPTDHDNTVVWEQCYIVPAGVLPVNHIRCNMKTYSVGNIAERGILTHNPAKP